jgi:hypothetical protein
MRCSLLLSLLLFNACASGPSSYPQHTLVDQILRPRTGYTGLTNSWCERWEDGRCQSLKIEDHPLTPEFRKQLNDFKFICRVGDRRFKVCVDKEGLCRREVKDCGHWWCRDKVIEVFIPITDYQYLLNANTKCFNRNRYPYWDL